tara:strand:- start:1004 stop:2980 length:1977 start_codon:yes stop_codon:yes gene_type:complete
MTIFAAAHPHLAEALIKRGFVTMTDVQSAVLADSCHERDLLVSAQTGSGKTVAFGLSMADQLLGSDAENDLPSQPAALIITPTRELALQVKTELDWLYAETDLVLASAVGGMDIRAERRALSGRVDVLIGTPGRLVDHLKRNSFDPDNLRVVVLDEADEMLDMGFREDLETLLKAAPEQRRTLMFSATVPRTIAALARRYQRDAVRVETISAEEQHQDIAYQACSVRPADRQNAIINLLRFHDDKKAVIFCATRASVSYLATRLSNRGLSVVALSGDLNQAARNQAMQAMRDGRARVCVATDVAARGIDLPNLDLVIHADLPRTPDVLLHRSGRTGRAGRKGTAIIIVPENTYRKTKKLLQLAGIIADWGKAPDADTIRARDDERIVQNADLTAQPDEQETELQNKLTDSFSAEQLALALIRQHRRDLTAPEELGEAGDMNMVGEVKTYRWFSLSAGKGQDIHVRGLLSILSGRGGVKSSDVGDIYLHHSESHVAISESASSSFLGRLKDGHLTDDINVTQIERPTIPEGRDKAKRRQKKPSFGQKRQGRPSNGRPDDRTERVERSGPKRHKPISKEKSFSKKKPIRKDKSDQPGQADETFKEKKKRRKLPKSDKSERQNRAEKPSKAGQTLSISKKGGKLHKPKQGGFKPVRRKSSR